MVNARIKLKVTPMKAHTFYFRGRHNGWSLGFGETLDDAIENNDYYGDLYGAGWFETNEWEVIFWDVIEKFVKK